jgi:hypothetical protein
VSASSGKFSLYFEVNFLCEASSCDGDAEDRRALGGDVAVEVAQRAGLGGAAGRVVHRVEVQHQLPAAEILQA